MAEIELSSLAHSYHASPSAPDDYAIRQINHIWEQGGAYALLGPSGCGKSTLLNIISGLLSPSEGHVRFDGKEVNHLSPAERNIAQVFQFPVVYDTMTVYDNLAFPLRNLGKDKASIDQRVREIAAALELDSELMRKANNLSADDKQKVSMGRGLVRDDVSAILLDEPLTVIDPSLKWKLRRQLKRLHQQFNITMVLVTHDQLEASTFADKIAVMYQGQIVQNGSPQELFEQPAHTFVGYFIGSPGMNFIEVSLDNGCADFGGLSLPLDASVYSAAVNLSSQQTKLGIRPEFVRLYEQPKKGTFEARVTNVENLGAYKIVTIELAGKRLKARIEEDDWVPTDYVYAGFPQQWLKVYADDYLVTVA
ncbi:MAG: glycerol transport system ATP-binding protein [Arenicella sp.]|jgi:glycerol transport system ATP-binding protein